MCRRRKWWENILFLTVVITATHIFSYVYVKWMIYPIITLEPMVSLAQIDLKYVTVLLVNILMGMFFGIESLWRQHKTTGRWNIDLFRLVFVGLPLLFLSIEYFSFHLLVNWLHNMALIAAPAREPFLRFCLGYVIITSFYKKSRNPSTTSISEIH